MPTSKTKIPTGDSKEDIKAREKIISDFYYDWYKNNPAKKVFNIHLKDYINVRYISINETIRHASKNYYSTLAVLQLDAILSNATKYGKRTPTKQGVKNQEPFSYMIEMRYELPYIGTAKLMVGVKKNSKEKIQYCITAIKT